MPPPQRRKNDKWDTWDLRIRDSVLFITGVLGIVNEIWFATAPRPSLLIFLGSLVGLPLALEADRRRRYENSDE